jgi:hypothetical protein
MGGSFKTDPGHSNVRLQPLRLAMRKEHLFGEAKELVEDLSSWVLDSADEEAMTLSCTRSGGLLTGDSKVTIRIEGPEEIPNSTVHVSSATDGGLLKRDKAVVLEFMIPFHRRVC